MEHAQHPPSSFPWRAATVVVGAIAAIELVALVAIGAVRLAPSPKHRAAAAAVAAAKPPVAQAAAPAPPPVPAHALKARAQTRVLVLNGNGRAGAAGTQAIDLRTLGYAVAGAENAPRRDYARTMVMYVPGFLPEARRLARDLGVRLVSPVDGLRPSGLKGSKLVVLLGN